MLPLASAARADARESTVPSGKVTPASSTLVCEVLTVEIMFVLSVICLFLSLYPALVGSRAIKSRQATTVRFPFAFPLLAKHSPPILLAHFIRDAGLVNTTPHPRRRGGQSVPNESRESLT
jgi:hypothetical protein